jgi:CRP/FNR family transcriptional regulator, nitrogen fixation regulation protein
MVFDPLAEIADLGRTVALRRGQGIYEHDAPSEFCWRVLTGCARSVRVMGDGRRQIGEFHWAGDLLGLNDIETHFADAEAVSDIVLRRYSRTLVEAEARRNTVLTHWLRANAQSDLRRARRQLTLLGRKTAIERIATFLLDLDRRADGLDDDLLELPMDRTDIADHLGLSTETVCRNLARMHRDRTIAIERLGVTLRDRPALRGMASE